MAYCQSPATSEYLGQVDFRYETKSAPGRQHTLQIEKSPLISRTQQMMCACRQHCRFLVWQHTLWLCQLIMQLLCGSSMGHLTLIWLGRLRDCSCIIYDIHSVLFALLCRFDGFAKKWCRKFILAAPAQELGCTRSKDHPSWLSPWIWPTESWSQKAVTDLHVNWCLLWLKKLVK